MTEQQFGDAVGVTRGAVQQWEKEGGTAPRRANQQAVADILGISVAELMDPINHPSTPALPSPAAPPTLAATLARLESHVRELAPMLQGAGRDVLARLARGETGAQEAADTLQALAQASRALPTQPATLESADLGKLATRPSS